MFLCVKLSRDAKIYVPINDLSQMNLEYKYYFMYFVSITSGQGGNSISEGKEFYVQND